MFWIILHFILKYVYYRETRSRSANEEDIHTEKSSDFWKFIEQKLVK